MTAPETSARRPYMRPMKGWWRRNTYYIEYMLHEGTAVFVAAYALILLVGLLRLSQGEVAWNAWLDALKSPLSIVFNVIILIAVTYHAWTWFRIMPMTLPAIRLNGKRLSAATITRSGLAAAIIASLVLLLLWGLWA